MKKIVVILFCLLLPIVRSRSQELLTDIYDRDVRSLNGKWDAIVDPYDQGGRLKVWENRKPASAEEFFEYSFDGGLRLDVPGDWNSQSSELK